ncbi:MAG: DUF4112 domain-containing protein [Cyanobacteriota bacterium]|nr:DUF4112 domain-containing protein [Cyanobacteriota bacterium]
MPESFERSTLASMGELSHSDTVRHLRKLSHLLDNAIPIPGTRYRLGLDPILGLIPGGGDVAGAVLSAYIIYRSAQMGMPAKSLGRMASNVLIEMLVGTIPVIGDFFDVGWKANVRNVQLLEEHVGSDRSAKAADKRLVFAIVAGIVLVAIGLAVVMLIILRLIFQLIGLG